MNKDGVKKQYSPKDFERKRYLADLKLLAPVGEEKAKEYAMLVFTILALSFFGLFAINPTIGTIVELRKKLADSLLVQDQLTRKIASMESLQQQYAQLNQLLDTIYAAIPQDPNVPRLLGQFQAMAQDNQVTIVQLKTFPVPLQDEPKLAQKTDAGDTYFTFSLDTVGSYHDLQQFLESLTSFDRIVNITKVSLTKTGSKGEAIEMTVEGQAFYQHEK